MRTDMYLTNAPHYTPEEVEAENERFKQSDQGHKLISLAKAHNVVTLAIVRRLSRGAEPSIAAFVDIPKERFFEFMQQVAEHEAAGECHFGADSATLRRFGIVPNAERDGPSFLTSSR